MKMMQNILWKFYVDLNWNICIRPIPNSWLLMNSFTLEISLNPPPQSKVRIFHVKNKQFPIIPPPISYTYLHTSIDSGVIWDYFRAYDRHPRVACAWMNMEKAKKTFFIHSKIPSKCKISEHEEQHQQQQRTIRFLEYDEDKQGKGICSSRLTMKRGASTRCKRRCKKAIKIK